MLFDAVFLPPDFLETSQLKRQREVLRYLLFICCVIVVALMLDNQTKTF